MRRARIETRHENAVLVAAAVSPDNTDSMRTTVDGDAVVTEIERETTGGLQSTVDDYVVNLTVAETVAQTANTHRNQP
ncbi:KEOPS complex subunit Pcc1 [Halegenticoccus soli]|uniref:KEOPS complex subunit Pcc1 n=1 Tax=Halegenticoccus soli TaxID=1985678 RepID=UPI000C6D0BF1|nr:KEOPS complex subunit Pcc1 [Halegenticoccus soli]